MRTVIYAASDLARAKAWYAQAFATNPYFDESFYVGFNIGGYELGLDPNAQIVDGSTIAYWAVAPRSGSCCQQQPDLGATAHANSQDVGEGIKTASVKDPFGNVIGLIENPHFST